MPPRDPPDALQERWDGESSPGSEFPERTDSTIFGPRSRPRNARTENSFLGKGRGTGTGVLGLRPLPLLGTGDAGRGVSRSFSL